jgi:hypothetical protein
VPSSLTIAPGPPRLAISALISRTTRFPDKDVSGIAARHSLVPSSMIVSTRNRRPSASWSCTKSVDQRLFGPAGFGIGGSHRRAIDGMDGSRSRHRNVPHWVSFFRRLPPCLIGIEACAGVRRGSRRTWSSRSRACGRVRRPALQPPAPAAPRCSSLNLLRFISGPSPVVRIPSPCGRETRGTSVAPQANSSRI